MIVGFNHNVLYQGTGFHVQTEDSGLKSPSLVTLLYHGGIIVSAQKTSYADILDVDNLSHVVEELAKEQHKGMLRRLTKGEFDQRICQLGIKTDLASAAPESQALKAKDSPPREDTAASGVAVESGPPPGAELPVAIEPAYEPPRVAERPPAEDGSDSLDDLIFSYLMGGDANR